MRESAGTYVALGSGVALVIGGLSLMYTAPHVPGATWVGAALALVGIAGFVVAWLKLRRERESAASPTVADKPIKKLDPLPPRSIRLSAEGVDLDEAIYQEPVSGRVWRYGDVSGLSESQRKDLEEKLPAVVRGYRDRLLRNVIIPREFWARTASAKMTLKGLVYDGAALLQEYRDVILLNPDDRATRGRDLERDAVYWRNRAARYLSELGLDAQVFSACSPQTAEPLTQAQLECHVERLRELQ